VTSNNLAALDGPANFRDLGGYATASGGVTRAGRLYRSDSLSYLSDRDVAALRDELGVRTVIDLRAGHEVEEYGHGPLAAHVQQLHLPIVDQTRDPPTPRRLIRRAPKFQQLDEIYAFMLREYAERFGAVLHVIADPGNHPLVFHCAAGKDRTGLVAALVLSLCDVPDDLIVSDFAFTESRMPEIIARHTARAEEASSDAEVAAQQYGAQAATMHVVLQTLRDEHGSVAGYVRSAGVTDDEIAALRAALVDG
jgi:protein tyrosine/serine phosphatase